ncbi:MAG: 50S ribosomal protein L15 [Pseudomonadota bacterium]|nr:50S ribosomal protein L15 [Pseudomonadota bacterium]
MADELSNLHPVPGAQRPRTRVGRGQGSGLGKTAGRGTKGQKARAGSGKRLGFEGGQIPLLRRQPKRGFRNIFAKDYTEVNVSQLGVFPAGTELDAQTLKASGVISRIGRDGLKVLGDGELSVALTIRASKFSASARSKIEAAGGTAAENAA